MILIVDDHADTRTAMVQLLKFDGYIAVAVSSGGEALEFLTRYLPRLVMLDHNMPDMTGLEVLAEMKKNPHTAKIPVIMFSANGETARDEALRAGVNAYIMKASMDWGNLNAEIARLIGPPTAAPYLPPTIETGDRDVV